MDGNAADQVGSAERHECDEEKRHRECDAHGFDQVSVLPKCLSVRLSGCLSGCLSGSVRFGPVRQAEQDVQMHCNHNDRHGHLCQPYYDEQPSYGRRSCTVGVHLSALNCGDLYSRCTLAAPTWTPVNSTIFLRLGGGLPDMYICTAFDPPGCSVVDACSGVYTPEQNRFRSVRSLRIGRQRRRARVCGIRLTSVDKRSLPNKFQGNFGIRVDSGCSTMPMHYYGA